PDYLTLSLELSRPGTLMVIDNVVRKGEIANAKSDDPNVRAVRKMNEMIAANPRLNATVIQTVGSKGYDGLAFVLVV
ncbi:MAG TPA: methyltransferase, partial [Thermoanaerobaculia bacterium]|nr:methyltransferase [Thermoanaerobaculia bacterium]